MLRRVHCSVAMIALSLLTACGAFRATNPGAVSPTAAPRAATTADAAQRAAPPPATPAGPTTALSSTPEPTATPAYGATATVEASAWEGLRRSLQLPTVSVGAPCPRSATQRDTAPDFPLAGGGGPVYVTPWDTEGLYDLDQRYLNREGWFSQKLLFIVGPGYRGPILVRGHQLDGPGELRFQESLGAPVGEEQRLTDPAGTSPTRGARHWGVYTLWRSEGCYALQFDGLDFSEIIVFQVVYR